LDYFPYFYDEDTRVAWDRAVDVEFLPDKWGRFELTALGQVIKTEPAIQTVYDWSMVDLNDVDKYIGLRVTASGNGAYLLDKYGFVHVMGDANPALGGLASPESFPASVVDEELGALRAVDVEVNSPEDTVYVLDSYGGVHIKGAEAAERGAQSRAFFGWDIARDIELFGPNGVDYVLDGFGEVHGADGESLPGIFYGTVGDTNALPYFGWDIARNLEFSPDLYSAWVLDGYGPAHPAGYAPSLPGSWFGWDIAVDLEVYVGSSAPK